MSPEPVLALAATPRDWAGRLHRHVADHGGARIRGTVLTAAEALTERYDVLLADDRTSFLGPRLVRGLQDSGRSVMGLYDPDDAQGKGDLVDWGVDETLPADLPPAAVLAAAQGLLARRISAPDHTHAAPPSPPPAPMPAPGPTERRAHVVVVRGVNGGAGRTEIALGLAANLAERGPTVLVELDEQAASLAPRLGLPPYPNLRAGADWARRASGGGATAVQRVSPGLSALVAGPLPRPLAPLPPDDVLTTLADLRQAAQWVVIDGGDRAVPGLGAAATVVVGAATPVGAARLSTLLAAEVDPVHLVVNRAPGSAYRRWELLEELQRAHVPRSLTTLPEDRGVFEASWRGRPATGGAFGRGVRRLAERLRDECEGTA